MIYRLVRIIDDNMLAEVIKEEYWRVKVRYDIGGFHKEVWISKEEIEDLPQFDYEGEE